MSQMIKLKQIMTQIKILLVFVICFFGCTREKSHKLFFQKNNEDKWCVIVNGCKNQKDYSRGMNNLLKFPNTSILLMDTKDFKISKTDSFFIDGEYINLKSESKTDSQLCYYSSNNSVND